MFDNKNRLPRLYKLASNILKEVSDGKASIKQLVFNAKHPNTKALYALVTNTFQRMEVIEKLLKKSKLLIKEPGFNPWIAKVLITELLWGKKRLSGKGLQIKTLLGYEQILRAHMSDDTSKWEQIEQVKKPRYVRINTLKLSTHEAIEMFRDEGWVLKRYIDRENYTGFLEAVANLTSEEFMVDFHVPYVLIFPPRTTFYKHSAYKNGLIFLQDKASCLPVHLLNPEPGATVLDMCAAPGMKTTQAAAVMQDKGKIYAVELGSERFKTLNEIVDASGATCIQTIHKDTLNLSEEQLPDVEYILVDPSCSGSGILERGEIGRQKRDRDQNRLHKLANLQIMLLKHAFIRYSTAKRVVYSTCSVYPEENEDVVRQVVEKAINFKLVPAGPLLNDAWLNYGSSEFGDIGNYCLYTKPDIDLTTGFFVAVFERLKPGETNQFSKVKLQQQNRNKRNHSAGDIDIDDEGDHNSTVDLEADKKRKSKKKKIKEQIDDSNFNEEYSNKIKRSKIETKEFCETEPVSDRKKKKHAKKSEEAITSEEKSEEKGQRKKKKADDKHKLSEDVTIEESGDEKCQETSKKKNKTVGKHILKISKSGKNEDDCNTSDEHCLKKKKKKKNKRATEDLEDNCDSQESKVPKEINDKIDKLKNKNEPELLGTTRKMIKPKNRKEEQYQIEDSEIEHVFQIEHDLELYLDGNKKSRSKRRNYPVKAKMN